MSASYPPPQPPAPGQNPYAQQPPPPPAQPAPGQPAGYGQPGPYGPPAPGTLYGAPQQPGAFNPAAYPPPPAARLRGNPALAVLAGLGAMLVAALLYGGLLRLMSKNDGSFYEFRLGAIAVGALVGVAIGKAGGRTVLGPIVAVLLALGAVILGELFGGALIISHYASTHDGSISTSEILFHHFDALWDTWKQDFGFKRVLFLLFAGGVSFGLAKRLGEG